MTQAPNIALKSADDGDAASVLLQLSTDCGPNGSITPEQVARALADSAGGDWHRLLTHVKRQAVLLANAGKLQILRKGRVIDPAVLKGVVRFRRMPDPAAPQADPSADGMNTDA